MNIKNNIIKRIVEKFLLIFNLKAKAIYMIAIKFKTFNNEIAVFPI